MKRCRVVGQAILPAAAFQGGFGKLHGRLTRKKEPAKSRLAGRIVWQDCLPHRLGAAATISG